MTPKAKALGDQPAFPVSDMERSMHFGMSTRTWLVGMAMQGFIASKMFDGPEIRAKASIHMADATLEELAKEEE